MMNLKIALPKGRLWDETVKVLKNSGIELKVDHRDYRPKCNIKGIKFYVMKPRNIPKMVESGKVDLGIVGLDLVHDESAKVDLMLDIKIMPVYIVLAGKKYPKKKHIIAATEYVNIARKYLKRQTRKNQSRRNKQGFEIIRTYGSTECFAPEFADVIIDHTQTGETLRKNNLKVFEIIMKSTAYLIASRNMDNTTKRSAEKFKNIIESGVKKMDFKYPGFLTEDQIMAIGYTNKQQ